MKAAAEKAAVAVVFAGGMGLLLMVTACGGRSGGIVAPGAGERGGADASALTAVTINLPDRSVMRQVVPDIETRMNAYQLTVMPVDPACPSATKVDELGDYGATAVLTASLKQGCDYDVTLALGHKGAAQPQPGNPPAAGLVTWEGQIKGLMEQKCGNCHGPVSTINGDLFSYAQAVAKGEDLVRRVQSGNMPMGMTLTPAEKDLYKAWKDGGFKEKAAVQPQPQPSTGSRLALTYYKTSVAVRIAQNEINGVAALRKPIHVILQPDGQAIGLDRVVLNPNPGGGTGIGTGIGTGSGTGTGTGTGIGIGTGTGTGIVIPTVTGTGTATSTGIAVTLPAEKDFELKGAGGATARLSSLFRGARYLVLDFSSSSCGYCVEDARELNGDTAKQARFTGGACAYVTIVGRNDLQSWVSATGGASRFVGQHSYEASTTYLGGLVQKLGASFGGTPTYVLLDNTGRVVRDFSGSGGMEQLGLGEACR